MSKSSILFRNNSEEYIKMQLKKYKSAINHYQFSAMFLPYLEYIARLIILLNFRFICYNYYFIVRLYSKNSIFNKINLHLFSDTDIRNELVFKMWKYHSYIFDGTQRNVYYYYVTTTNENLKDVIFHEFKIMVWENIIRITKICFCYDSSLNRRYEKISEIYTNAFTLTNQLINHNYIHSMYNSKDVHISLGNLVTFVDVDLNHKLETTLIPDKSMMNKLINNARLNYENILKNAKRYTIYESSIVDDNKNFTRGIWTHINRIVYDATGL